VAKKRRHQNRGSTGGRDQREKKPTAREALGRARLWRWWPLPALVLLAVLVLLTVSPDRHPPAGFPARRAAAGDTTELGTLPAGTPVIFLTIDTLREDHLSRSGYPRETTPFLDSLAAESVYFTRCFSQSSWTLPAMLTLISSLPPPIFGICDGVAPVPRTGGRPMPSRGAQPMTREVFAADHVTIAEVFREQG